MSIQGKEIERFVDDDRKVPCVVSENLPGASEGAEDLAEKSNLRHDLLLLFKPSRHSLKTS